MKIVVVILVALLSVLISSIVFKNPETADPRTMLLCHQYASRDHEKELAPSRWKWFTNRNINPNKDFDWYQSCINHNTQPLPKKTISIGL